MPPPSILRFIATVPIVIGFNLLRRFDRLRTDALL